MIALEHVTKSRLTNRGLQTVISDATCVFKKGQNVAILGADPEANSLLFSILKGSQKPSSGKIRRRGRIFTGISRLQPSLTGVENAKFACRIYGMDLQDVMDYIVRFTNFENALYQPVSTFTPEMKSRFNAGLCLGLHFDHYLIDSMGSALDARFLKEAASEFVPGSGKRDLILLTGSEKVVQRFCSHGVTLQQGKLGEVAPIDEALIQLQSSR